MEKETDINYALLDNPYFMGEDEDEAPQVEQQEPVVSDEPDEISDEPDEQDDKLETPTDDKPSTETPLPEFVNVGGQQVPLNELMNGYLRQSDYTKKTQELSTMKKQYEKELELAEYIKSNPDLAQKLLEVEPNAPKQVQQAVNPAMQEIEEIKSMMFQQRIDNDIKSLETKYVDFNASDVLDEATRIGTTDLESVYFSIRGRNIDAIVENAVKQQLASATKEMQKNSTKTSSIIGAVTDTKPHDSTHGLSDREIAMATKLNMTPKEYAKWK